MQNPSSSMLGTPALSWPSSSASLMLRVFSSLCCMEAVSRLSLRPAPPPLRAEPALPLGCTIELSLSRLAVVILVVRPPRPERCCQGPHFILSSDAVRGESREPAERGLLDASEARAGTRAPTVSVAVPRSRSGPGPTGSLSLPSTLSRRPGSGSWRSPA